MKIKAIFLLAYVSFWGYGSSFAQKTSGQDEVADKVTNAVEKLDAAVKLEKDKKKSVATIFQTFYEEQQKLKNHIQRPASGLAQGLAGQDFQSVRKKSEALKLERDKSLKEELTEQQYKKWKGEIEPNLYKRK